MHDEITPYQALGGEQGVRRLVDRFYDHMDQDIQVKPLRDLHAKDLRVSREKLFMFLSGWLGGPDLYVQKYGHPRLRARHLPFAIDSRMRDQWMLCMRQALNDESIDAALCQRLLQAFAATADHMRNQPEHTADPSLRIVPTGDTVDTR
jgi:hemoglobin